MRKTDLENTFIVNVMTANTIFWDISGGIYQGKDVEILQIEQLTDKITTFELKYL